MGMMERLPLLGWLLHPARVAPPNTKATKSCTRRRSYFLAAAFFAAQRFLSAAMIFALPAALSLRFGFAVLVTGAVGAPFALAHLSCWAFLIFFNAAALNLRLVPDFGSVAGLGALEPSPERNAFNSAICALIFSFWASKPAMAASIIVFVSLEGMSSISF
jgi:hypothetical protein